MKSKHISDALEGIDFDMVEDAGQDHRAPKPKSLWLRWGIVAAALILSAGALVSTFILMREDEPSSPSDTTVTDEADETLPPYNGPLWVDNRPRNDKQTTENEYAIDWPWHCLEVYEKYTSVIYNDTEYLLLGRYDGQHDVLSQSLVGEKLADAEAWGYDNTNPWDLVKRTAPCEIYEIKGVSPARIIAVKLEGCEDYSVMGLRDYDPPATLGELISNLNLTKLCPLTTFIDYNDDYKYGFERFGLTKDTGDTVWQMFLSYTDAPTQEKPADPWSQKVVSFSMTSEELGIYNHSWWLSEDGWLSTNVEQFGYYYYIGTETVEKIAAYVREHKTEYVYEPTFSIVGEVSEIGEDYIKIDDTIMMENPEDGMIFTVYAGNSNIKKYLACGYLSEGRKVMVTHKGIYADEPTVVRTALALHEVIISDGEVWIPE